MLSLRVLCVLKGAILPNLTKIIDCELLITGFQLLEDSEGKLFKIM
jgi:hypothetical protein